MHDVYHIFDPNIKLELHALKSCINCFTFDISHMKFSFDVLSVGMSSLQGPPSLERKWPELNSPAWSLTDHIYDVI
jgi:hypothetical protein